MIAEVLSSAAPVPEEYRGTEREVSALEVRVRAFQILTEPDHQAACALEQELAKAADKIAADFAEPKADAYKAHKSVCALETRLLGPLVASRPLLKQKIGAWREARRQEAERVARVAAEAARRQAEEEALARAKMLQDRGEPERADAVIQTFQAPAVVVAAPKAPSYGTRSVPVWTAVVEDKLALIAWVAQAPAERHVYLEANTSALSGQAKLFKATLSIPGVRAESRFS